jgi:predicted TIM-barrel fold metal-dependent hydrolase
MIQPIFDAHCQIIDPRFPLTSINGYKPSPFSVNSYLARSQPLGIVGGAVVSGLFQGAKQGYLLEALRRLGSNFVGVAQLPATVTRSEVETLNGFGIRAVRLDLQRGGLEQLEQFETLARRVYEQVGWHAELCIDSRFLPDLEARLLQLPRLSLDYLGLSKDGMPSLLRLAESGACIKACGFGRVDFPVAAALQDINFANPHSLVFGTDLPSICVGRRFEISDIELLVEALGERASHRALWENAAALYKI